MGAGAIHALPERLDRDLVKRLVPPDLYDASTFDRHASRDGTISKDVLMRRAAALQQLSEAAQLTQEGATAEAVLAKLRAAADADSEFLLAAKSYANALASAGKTEQALQTLVVFSQSEGQGDSSKREASEAAQLILVNSGIDFMNQENLSGALDMLSRAEALGPLPAQAQIVAATARFYGLRATLMNDGASVTAAAGLTQLHTDLEDVILSAGAAAPTFKELLQRVVAMEAFAAGLLDVQNGHHAAAAAKFEEAANTGEPQARCLAAEAYFATAINEFSRFVSARVRGAPTSSVPPPPPQLTRALSDQGHGELSSCAATASLAADTANMARAELMSSGSAGVATLLERLGKLEDMSKQLLGRIADVQQMDRESRLQGCLVETDVGDFIVSSDDEPRRDVEVSQAIAKSNASPGSHLKQDSIRNLQNSTGSQTDAKKHVIQFFEMLDRNGDGIIERQDLSEVMRHLGSKEFSDAEIEVLVGAVDTDGDGRIAYADFVDWLCGEDLPTNPDMRRVWQRSRRLLQTLDRPSSGIDLRGDISKQKVQHAIDSVQEKLAKAEGVVQTSLISLEEAQKKHEEQMQATGNFQQLIDMFSGLTGGTDVSETATSATADGPVSWHGSLGAGRAWEPPKLAARSQAEARPGYNAYDASEYLDTQQVLKEKVAVLADLWKQSRNCVIYTGAGLSTSAGIGDYASKAKGSVVNKKTSTGSRLELVPTPAHHGLAALGARGFVKHWVQQNHDRLAQKAGYPQAKLNEIHGAWGDSKNCVKMMDDILRQDLIDWLQAWTEQADMCIALGTSLCGMNADRIVNAVSARYPSSGQGLVVIGLQRSVYDGNASLRIWGLCDNVIKLVCKELGVPCPDKKVKSKGDAWIAKHPRLTYNTPKRTAKDPL